MRATASSVITLNATESSVNRLGTIYSVTIHTMEKPDDFRPHDTVRSQLRLPAVLHEQLKSASEATGRSMNAEIVARLEASFGAISAISHPMSWADMSVLLRARRASIQQLIEQVEADIAAADFDASATAAAEAELEDMRQLSDRIRQALVFVVKAKYHGDAHIPEDLLQLANDLVRMPF